jgi:OOP family OmpA-OmpF porin
MKIQQKAAIAASLMLLAGPISAQADGFYIGASVGNASLDEDFDGLVVDDDSTSYRIVAGWQFNDYFALEGGYHNFGDFEQTLNIAGVPSTVSLSADGFTLGGAGGVPVSERFALTARAGMYFWNGTAEVNNVSQATPEDSNLYLGAGIRFDVNERFQLTTDWTRYELEGAVSGVFSVGLQYQFR